MVWLHLWDKSRLEGVDPWTVDASTGWSGENLESMKAIAIDALLLKPEECKAEYYVLAVPKMWFNHTFKCAECNFYPACVGALRVHRWSLFQPGSRYHSAPNQRISEVEAKRKIWPWVSPALKHYLTVGSRVHNLIRLFGFKFKLKGLKKAVFDDPGVHIHVSSHLWSRPLSPFVSAGFALSHHLGHLSPRARVR